MTTEQFNSLPREVKAVSVAQDILEQIRLQKVTPTEGEYMTIYYGDLEEYTNSLEIDVKSNIDKLKNCQACALGAAILSITKFGNRLTFKELKDFTNSETALDLLSTVFSAKQMLLIETAFENFYDHEMDVIWFEGKYEDEESFDYYDDGSLRLGKDKFNETLTWEEAKACVAFHNEHSTSEDRLKAICDNIIRNKGTFIP